MPGSTGTYHSREAETYRDGMHGARHGGQVALGRSRWWDIAVKICGNCTVQLGVSEVAVHQAVSSHGDLSRN